MTVRITAYSAVWALLLLGAIQPSIAAQPACLPSAVGSQDVINDLFRNGESFRCVLSLRIGYSRRIASLRSSRWFKDYRVSLSLVGASSRFAHHLHQP